MHERKLLHMWRTFIKTFSKAISESRHSNAIKSYIERKFSFRNVLLIGDFNGQWGAKRPSLSVDFLNLEIVIRNTSVVTNLRFFTKKLEIANTFSKINLRLLSYYM